MNRVYMDWNATAPLRPEARDAMIAAMDVVGNPSSVHAEGRAAKGIIERARGQVAALVGCNRDEIVFTSGATESASAVFDAVSFMGAICSRTEHDAVLSHIGTKPPLIVGNNGIISLANNYDIDVLGVIEKTDLITIQSANSETGICQDLDACIKYVRERTERILTFSDIVQSCGKEAFSVSWLELDYAIISSHKFGGPKGVGAFFEKAGRSNLEANPLIRGGGQEQGRRSGTENVIGIAGFGAAAEAAARDLADGVWDQVAELRDYLEERIAEIAPEVIIFGKDAKRLPNTSNFAIPGWKGETQVMQMDLAGYAISAGSACSSGKVKVSRVLQAMGFDDVTAASAIRVSLGPTNTKDEIDGFVSAWGKFYKKFSAKAA